MIFNTAIRLLALLLLALLSRSGLATQDTSGDDVKDESSTRVSSQSTQPNASQTRLRGSHGSPRGHERFLKGKMKAYHKFSMNYHPKYYARHKTTPPPSPRPAQVPNSQRPRAMGSMYRSQANAFGTMKQDSPAWYENNPRHRYRHTNNHSRGKYPTLPTLWPRIPSDSGEATPQPPVVSPTLPPPDSTTTLAPTGLLFMPAASILVPQCPAGRPLAALWGSIPHILTHDGLAFDAPAVQGDFVLAQGPGFALQARVEANIDFPTRSGVTTAVALQLGDESVLEVALARQSYSSSTGMWRTSCAMDAWQAQGRVLDLPDRASTATLPFADSRVQLSTTDGTLDIHVPTVGISVTVQPIESGTMGCYLNVIVCFDQDDMTTTGLLGTPNGNFHDDWQTHNGQVIPIPADRTGMEAYDYATSNWCYAPGEVSSLFRRAELWPGSPQNFCQARPYQGRANPNDATALVQEICNAEPFFLVALHRACLVSGVVGTREEAQYARWVMAQLQATQQRTLAPSTTPTTSMPTTLAPSTLAPTTVAPTTTAPTTVAPTTVSPTMMPTVAATQTPTTATPSTILPTTNTTQSPTTAISPTGSPVTVAPSTPVPSETLSTLTPSIMGNATSSAPPVVNVTLPSNFTFT